MKVGDLVKYDKKLTNAPERLGIVLEVKKIHGLPSVLVHWNGLDGHLVHRQDLLVPALLEVVE